MKDKKMKDKENEFPLGELVCVCFNMVCGYRMCGLDLLKIRIFLKLNPTANFT